MPAPIQPQEIRFGRFTLRPASRTLLEQGELVGMGARAFDVLAALVERRHRPVSKSELMDAVWPGVVVEENTLQVHVSTLRKVLGATSIATIPGRGYQFTAALEEPPAAELVAPATTPSNAHNLPRPATPFIGRGAALAQCSKLLTYARLLTLTGIGGCGKTRLALQLAERNFERYPDGVWFVDLAPIQEPHGVPAAIAAALGLREEAGTPLPKRLAAHLSGRCALVVLDNCEHVVDAVAETAHALLDACGALTLLATSREGLGLEGEQIYPVRPLALPPGSRLADITESEAVCLFVDRARQALPDFAITEENAPVVADICRRLDGIALAIELAAARVDMLSLAEIETRLDDRFRLLVGGARALPRHQTLQTTLQWSHDSLTPHEQRAFARLSVFAGGCTLDAATEVVNSGDEYDALKLLTDLHRKSLLVVDGLPEQPRYRMLETVRQYAQHRLAEAGEGEDARERHLKFQVALAETAASHLQGPQQGLWMARLEAEQDNLLAAHSWSSRNLAGRHHALKMVACLSPYWIASGQLERGRALAEAALGADAAPGDVWHCRAVWALGQLNFRMGRYDEALACADSCLSLARAIGDAEQLAAGLSLKAKGLQSTAQSEHAQVQYEEACRIARTLPSPALLGSALNNLAELHRAAGHTDAARACYEEAIAVTRRMGSPQGMFVPLCNLARLCVASGKLQLARTLLLESLQLATGAELKGMGEDVLEVAAGLASQLQQHAMAARFWGAAQSRMVESGSQREPVDEAFIAPLIVSSLAAMGRSAFEDAQGRGLATSRTQAIDEVRAWLELDAS